MKKYWLFFLIPIVAIFFFACIPVDQDNSLQICACYAVPGMSAPDLKEDRTVFLEQDEYGRVLFTFSAFSYVSGQKECVAVICQKYDKDFIYFYEDACYSPYNFKESDINSLKNDNDWNKPLNSVLMSRRPNTYTLDGVIRRDKFVDYRKACDMLATELGIDTTHLKSMWIDDVNSTSLQELFFVEAENGNSEIQKYLVIIDQAYTVNLLPIENNNISSSQIAEFKAQCGWE